ncbi:ATP-binding protein [Hoeflea prorocentri]|uniref:histidine kinase n=1 Tax=Hoeflea prorocentri TaxID=1922333 RepID=A0A9X3UJ74_9HYPH|nr:ATP-binding protein [Hoeflea prorocentri]MCY6381581.1 ATP-binding protein [Hoeflea prorocentri]MDA5399381.1 ATP-binding protein [Hoeflea prorocentri]
MTDSLSRLQPSDVLLVSQAASPERVRQLLLVSAIREGWIALLVNFNMAIFFGVILLTSGIDPLDAMIFLGIQIGASSFTILLWIYLLMQPEDTVIRSETKMNLLVLLGDSVVMAGWGCGVLLLYGIDDFDRTVTLILLLIAAGIASAALSAKLINVLLCGRGILFLPSFIFLILQQPPLWGLHAGILVFGFFISVGVGYAAHIQHLRVASLNMYLRETHEALAVSLDNEKQSASRSLADAALREQFLRSVTHDLRQPINALQLFLDELSRLGIEQIRKIVDASTSCVRSANTIIESVAQLAWINNGTPTPRLAPFPLMPLLEQVGDEIRPMAEEKGLDLRIVKTSATALADQAFMERILRNLAHNGLQYCETGKILVGVRRRANGLLEICVGDTGPGIAEEDVETVFRAYHRRANAGGQTTGNIGLGLTIVRDLAEAMGGSVRVSSKLQHGSLFGVTIPAGTSIQQKGPQRLEGVNILVVDDDADFARHLRARLSESGARVTMINDQDAIRDLMQDTLPNHDVVILDYDLGDAGTAAQFLAGKDLSETQRTLVLTNSPDIARSELRGPDTPVILPKSASEARLIAAIGTLLVRKEPV